MRYISHDTVMWFGKYKDRLASTVPASYLKWVHDNVDGVEVVDEELLWEDDCRGDDDGDWRETQI